MAESAGGSGSRTRPQYRNINVAQLAKYRLPLAGIVSILHRVSGALMFLVGLPFMLYLFQQSITSEISFESYRAVVSHWFAKLVLIAVAWAYLHHFCAGIRFLFLDLDIGTNKEQSRVSASIVMGVSLVLTLAVALKIFGVL